MVRRLWLYLLFIVAYSHVGAARNWSHKGRTSSQGSKIEAESREQRWTFWVGVGRRKQTLFGAWKPPKCIYWV